AMTSLVAKEASSAIALPRPHDEPAAHGGGHKRWIFLVKVSVSLALIGLLVSGVDIGRLVAILRNASPWPFMAAVLAFSIQCSVAGLRCRSVVGPRWPISVRDHVRFFWIGQFFNQLLPSTIGGDAIRAWLLSRRGPPLPTAIKLTVVDRLTGVIALMLVMLLLAGLSMASPSSQGNADRMLGLIASFCLFGLALALVLLRWKALIVRAARFAPIRPIIALLDEIAGLIGTPLRAIQVFGLALVVHLCSIAAFWLSARAIDAPLGLIEAALVVPPMLLIAMMPISVAGWGVREGVVLIGLQGVSAETAISIALLFGLALLIASLPGSLLWLARRQRPNSTSRQAEAA
ncbi:MAG: lysylphosphatidylglycerol synthase transmembrane domain-containing protein, partial [Geminicoccaceae bacterium]